MIDFSLDELVRVYREEKTSKELVELPDDFYQIVGRYVSQMGLELRRSNALRKELLEEELRSVVLMVQEVYFTRVFKAMGKVAHSQQAAPLLERERDALSEIRQSLEKLRMDLIQPVVSGKVEVAVPQDITHGLMLMLVEFRDKIVGADMRSYGPFAAGEIASLPSPNSDMLIRHGLARKITVKV